MRRRAVLAALIGVLLGVLLTQYAVSVMRVSGSSMAPLVQDGEAVLLLRKPLLQLIEALGARPLRDGAVIALADPQPADAPPWRRLLGPPPPLLKRIVALPGQTLEYRQGERLLDGEPAPEGWAALGGGRLSIPATRLGDEEYFVLGDDRLPLSSRDSRAFGPVPSWRVQGLALVSFRAPREKGVWRWPVSAVGP